MLRTGDVEEVLLVLDGMEESLRTNVRIVVMWNSILRSKEMKMLSHKYSIYKVQVYIRISEKSKNIRLIGEPKD
jgi:hypothetical protein